MITTRTIFGSTRARLLDLLRRSRRSINELAAALGVTDNAVRAHIAVMERDGLVQPAGQERATGGKPAQLYEITAGADEIFPKAYGFVLGELLDLLHERYGHEEVLHLLRELGGRSAGTVDLRHLSEEERVLAAADVLRRIGGEVEVEKLSRGWLIRGFACPLSSVVATHPDACALAEALVGRVAGMAATEGCDRAGRPRCAFRLEPLP